MVASPSSTASSSSSCSCNPIPSGSGSGSGAHRRRLTDAAADDCFVQRGNDGDDDRGHGAGALRVKALFFARTRTSSGGKRVPVVDQAWVRYAVACLLGVAVVVGLVMSSSRRGAIAGAGRKLVHSVDNAEVLGCRTEKNLTAVARRPPDPPVRTLAVAAREYLLYTITHACTSTRD